ncbi:amidohydrolase [Pseudomaricurvus alkylphenolicus]|jgi:predicted amidohydrolase YtcJ|uniref:amidohydrolase n=1 Tax=Pseudomaricurvus alkylphenolicus TaxID=1306991 RepID=UPI0014223A8C|nr:amidohydrolase [Pseudomaricurvus alkylphenolicus]NIB40547.1 amidohydrolase [Pseudomaricurvus alkylphenolicus]
MRPFSLLTAGASSLLAACAMLAGCNSTSISHPAADTVITNGRIYTIDALQPWVEAVAISNGRYTWVGKSEDAQQHIGVETRVIDLAGRMAMPGINDAHLHPARGGTKELFECNFPFSASPEQIQARVAQCVKDNPSAVWIRGGQWDSGFFDTYQIDNPRDFLDAVSGDKAVVLNDDSNHNGWVNSKALELAGITKDTPDPSDGTYVRDPATGEPNGILLEGAEQLMMDQLPDWSQSEYRQGVREAVRIANRFGITGMKDAMATEPAIAAYHELDQRDELSIHMAAAIATPYGHRQQPLDYERIDRIRKQYASAHVHPNSVKLFSDGVPTASRTAAMLKPYVPIHPDGAAFAGMLHLEPELMATDLIELDKRGYTVKIHTAGDRSVRVALDAIEAARKVNGDSGLRHELAHAGYIDPNDLPRFVQLQAVADLSPYLWHPSPIIDSIVSAVGSPRGEQYWPIRDLLSARAPVLAGSDWPAAVETIDPWLGLEAMVSRADPKGVHPGTFWNEQAINIEQALRIFTLDGAAALGLKSVTGSVQVGKSADLIVLNHNLLEVSVEDISETRVELTLFEGEDVYENLDTNTASSQKP